MPNRIGHMTIAAGVVGGAVAVHECNTGIRSAKPIAAAGLAAILANLPDQVEPAIHPHHRQFFHSVGFGIGIAYAGYRLYQWKPTDPLEKVARFVLLVACGAYIAHLAADGFTARSLPIVGKL